MTPDGDIIFYLLLTERPLVSKFRVINCGDSLAVTRQDRERI